jgi:CelD/BcsL family acetyltransferase involved in cellulose biosynthesis
LEVYKGISEIERSISVPEWERMFNQSDDATVYNHPHFVMNWFRTLSRLRGNVPILIKGTVNNRTIIFPLELYKVQRYFYEFKVLSGIGGAYNIDFQDPLVSGQGTSSEEKKIFWKELFHFVRSKIPECDQIVIPRLREATAAALGHCEQSTVSPYLDLKGYGTLDEVLSRCNAGHRGQVKKQIRKLEEVGAVTMRVFRGDEKEAAKEELCKFFEAYERQWGQKGSHISEIKESQNLFNHLIDDMLATGLIHFSALKCGDVSIHWHYGFLHKNRFHWYKPGYDVAWSKYSPGKVHVAYLIDECVRNGIRYFDFLYGDEPYKYSWAPTDAKLYSVSTWNGLRPMRYFVEELLKPAYRNFKNSHKPSH